MVFLHGFIINLPLRNMPQRSFPAAHLRPARWTSFSPTLFFLVFLLNPTDSASSLAHQSFKFHVSFVLLRRRSLGRVNRHINLHFVRWYMKRAKELVEVPDRPDRSTDSRTKNHCSVDMWPEYKISLSFSCPTVDMDFFPTSSLRSGKAQFPTCASSFLLSLLLLQINEAMTRLIMWRGRGGWEGNRN